MKMKTQAMTVGDHRRADNVVEAVMLTNAIAAMTIEMMGIAPTSLGEMIEIAGIRVETIGTGGPPAEMTEIADMEAEMIGTASATGTETEETDTAIEIATGIETGIGTATAMTDADETNDTAMMMTAITIGGVGVRVGMTEIGETTETGGVTAVRLRKK